MKSSTNPVLIFPNKKKKKNITIFNSFARKRKQWGNIQTISILKNYKKFSKAIGICQAKQKKKEKAEWFRLIDDAGTSGGTVVADADTVLNNFVVTFSLDSVLFQLQQFCNFNHYYQPK